jgi:hypothetical protein
LIVTLVGARSANSPFSVSEPTGVESTDTNGSAQNPKGSDAWRGSIEIAEEIDKMVRENFVPLIKKADGFVPYYWLDTGKGEGASVSVFRDKAGADESILLAADYVKTHMSKLVNLKPEVIEGPVKAHD